MILDYRNKRRRPNTFKHCNETPISLKSIKARIDIFTHQYVSPDGSLGENYNSSFDDQMRIIGSRVPEINEHHSTRTGNRLSFITGMIPRDNISQTFIAGSHNDMELRDTGLKISNLSLLKKRGNMFDRGTIDEPSLKTNIHVNNHNKVKHLTTDSYLEHSLKPAAAKTGHPTQPKDLLSSVNNSSHHTWIGSQGSDKREFLRKIRRNTKRKRSLSETKEYRLLQTCLRVLDFKRNIRRVKVALDTQSNVSDAEPYLGTPRQWRSHESKLVKGIGVHSRGS